MAANKSNYLEGKIIEHILRNVSYTSPTTVYAALYTSDPTEADSGTEVSGNGYTRMAITFGAHSNGTCTNSADVLFPQASGGNWGTITHFGIRDASSAGNLLYYGALTSSVVINDTEQMRLAAGAISVQET